MFPVRRLSIPRWILVAMAVLLALAIFSVAVHPDYDVSQATLGDRLVALMLAIVQVLGTGAVCIFIVFHLLPAAVSTPRPIPVMERNRVRRI